MDKCNYQESILFKLYADWKALIKLRGDAEPGTPQRELLDLRYNRVLPYIAMITDINHRHEIEDLAKLAMDILEKKESEKGA